LALVGGVLKVSFFAGLTSVRVIADVTVFNTRLTIQRILFRISSSTVVSSVTCITLVTLVSILASLTDGTITLTFGTIENSTLLTLVLTVFIESLSAGLTSVSVCALVTVITTRLTIQRIFVWVSSSIVISIGTFITFFTVVSILASLTDVTVT